MWVKCNPNPLGKQTSDCVVRAISVATNKSWRRVYDEPRRLVDHKDVVIFEDDVERNVLRLRLGGHGRRDGDVNDVGFIDLGAGLGGDLAIHLDESGVDKPLQPRPGEVGIEGGQADIEAFAHQNCQAL